LERRFDHGDGGFEFVCRVGDEGALLIEGALQSLEDAFESMGERSEFGGFAGGGGRMEGPGIGGDVAGEGCEFAKRRKTSVKDPCDEGPSNDDEEEHAGGVELYGSEDGVPDVLGGCAVEDDDEAEVATGNFAGIDDARTCETQETVAMVVNFRCEEAVSHRDLDGGAAEPVCGAAEEMAATVPDFVDIFGWDVEVGEIKHDVVTNVFRILDGAEDGVGATAEHDVEGAEVGVPFIAPDEEYDQDGRGELDEQYGSDKAKGDASAGGAAAARHEEGSGERR